MPKHQQETYWTIVWNQFRHHTLGMIALAVVALFVLVGVYAPFLASSKPLIVRFDGTWYFPLFRYLFFPGFFTKRVDLFYNLLIFTLPLFVAALCLRRRLVACSVILLLQVVLFIYVASGAVKDPASDPSLNAKRNQAVQARLMATQGQDPLLAPLPTFDSWSEELTYLNDYGRLNLVLNYWLRKHQNERVLSSQDAYSARSKGKSTIPTLWHIDLHNEQSEIARQQEIVAETEAEYPKAREGFDTLVRLCGQWKQQLSQHPQVDNQECRLLQEANSLERQRLSKMRSIIRRHDEAQAKIRYLTERRQWLEEQSHNLQFMVMPLLRNFHWEDDAGGEQSFNQYIGWMERTRINRKDLVAGLIFGIRISLMVGAMAVGLALLIGIPIGALAGYYAGTLDIVVCRLMEIWEAMPTFFMLLMVVAITQSKSIFLVIAVIGIFGWTSFSRYIRGEFFKQRNLPYVEACHALGFKDARIIFGHVLPNAIPPVLTLLPFSVMAAITSEAGLSFLGLGEEGSCSWGVLMDEGRAAFPGESYLLWPPAIMLTILLVAIALVGDAFRDALDPRMRKQ